MLSRNSIMLSTPVSSSKPSLLAFIVIIDFCFAWSHAFKELHHAVNASILLKTLFACFHSHHRLLLCLEPCFQGTPSCCQRQYPPQNPLFPFLQLSHYQGWPNKEAVHAKEQVL